MTNSIAPSFGGGSLDPQALATALGQTAAAGSSNFDGCELMKMDKSNGEWIYGQSSIEIYEEDHIVINPFSLEHGFICWKESRVVGERNVSITQPLPSEEDLPNTGESWDAQLIFKAKLLSGEGEDLMYKVSSHGGKEAVSKLAGMISSKLQSGSSFYAPIVSLGSTSYKHKQYGKIYKPVFNIVGWLDPEDGTVEGETKALESAPAKQEEQQEPAPQETPKANGKRQRRRRAAS